MFLKGDCHELPFTDGSFDLIISRNVTHALRDQRKVYAEWRRVLRPGWDVSVLRKAGFAEITTEDDVTEKLWDDKEKLLYGATPTFMIKAVK